VTSSPSGTGDCTTCTTLGVSSRSVCSLAIDRRLRLDGRGLGISKMRILGIVALCAALGGCVTAETVSFRASNPQQQAMMRAGQPALVSRQKSSLVLVRPADRQLQVNGRPVFVVGINNLAKQPVEFRVGQVEAVQHVGASDFEMQVVTYEMLVQEEKTARSPGRFLRVLQPVPTPTAPHRPVTAHTPRPTAEQARSTVPPLRSSHRTTPRFRMT